MNFLEELKSLKIKNLMLIYNIICISYRIFLMIFKFLQRFQLIFNIMINNMFLINYFYIFNLIV